MDPFEAMKNDLVMRVPYVQLEVDAPLDKKQGIWTMDVRLKRKMVVVQYNPKLRKFGVSVPSGEYETKPDEVFNDIMSASGRVIELLK